MGIKVQYVGSRSYTELLTKGQNIGFGRGEIQTVNESVGAIVKALVDNGSTMWRIVGEEKSVPEKTQEMKATIEPTVEEPVEEAAAEESVDMDYKSMTRAQLMSLAKERGITTKNTMKKSTLVELLSA